MYKRQVLTTEQADRALAAGASFIVAPGFDPEVCKHVIDKGGIMMPGTCLLYTSRFDSKTKDAGVMREKFRQFMIGRYGTDGLNQFLSIASIVLLLISLDVYKRQEGAGSCCIL